MTDMPSGAQPKPGPFATAVSDEIRHLLTDRRVSGAQLAGMIGKSQSYVSKRLRNLASFTANDCEDICLALNVDLLRLLSRAVQSARKANQ